MNTRQLMVGLMILGLLAASLISCNFWRDDPSSPTSLGDSSAEQYGQFFATGDATEVFEWNYEDGAEVFCVSFPEPGDYLLTYQTDTGVWHIVLRINNPVYTYIGLLPGNILTSVTLERGTIAADATPLIIDGDIERYATPSVPAVWWGTVFTVEAEVPMERGQGECRVIINTKKVANALSLQANTRTPRARPSRQKTLHAAENKRHQGSISNEKKEARRQERREKLKKNIQQQRKSR